MVNCHFEQGAVWDPKASLHCIDLHVVVIINVKTHVKLYFRNWPLLADPLKPLSQQATSSPYYFFNRPRQHVHYFASRDTHVLWTWGSLPFKVSQRAATHVLFLDTGKDITTSLKELVESFLSRVARRQRYVYVYIYKYIYICIERERCICMRVIYLDMYITHMYIYRHIYIYTHMYNTYTLIGQDTDWANPFATASLTSLGRCNWHAQLEVNTTTTTTAATTTTTTATTTNNNNTTTNSNNYNNHDNNSNDNNNT